MLYTKHNIGDIDLGKYKRFVAIGCSFTRWLWPTWSDLLAREMPNAHYVNVARGGAGNQYIITTLNLLERKYNFGPETLVGIMWSTFCRQDWFSYENSKPWNGMCKDGGWHSQGNLLFSQPEDPFLNLDMLEPVHFLLRDTALISNANAHLKTAKFDTINLCSLDLPNQIPHGTGQIHGYEDPGDKLITDILEANQDLDDDFVGYIQRWGEPWPEAHVYPTEENPEWKDYHPRCIDYANMLDKWGLPVSDDTREYAQGITQTITDVKDPKWLRTWPHFTNPSHHDEMTFFEDHFTDT